MKHPVESVHDHVFATKIFNTIGIRTLIKVSSKYNFPSYSLYPIGERICLYLLLLYTTLGEEGSLTLRKNVTAEVCTDSVFYLLRALEKASPPMTFRHRGKKFIFPWEAAVELATISNPAIIKIGNGRFPSNGNHLLHTVEHYRNILL